MPLIRPLPQARASITFSVQTVHHDRYLEPYIRLLRTKKGLANSIRPLLVHHARVVILPVERAQKPGPEISVELVASQEVFGRSMDALA
jgi:hypothetical protein